MNYAAYALSGLFLFFMLSDFIKIERARKNQEEGR